MTMTMTMTMTTIDPQERYGVPAGFTHFEKYCRWYGSALIQ